MLLNQESKEGTEIFFRNIFKGEEIMSKFINVGVGEIDEDKDMRKGTFKSPKRKQSFWTNN